MGEATSPHLYDTKVVERLGTRSEVHSLHATCVHTLAAMCSADQVQLLRVEGIGCRAWGLGCRLQGLGVLDLGSRV